MTAATGARRRADSTVPSCSRAAEPSLKNHPHSPVGRFFLLQLASQPLPCNSRRRRLGPDLGVCFPLAAPLAVFAFCFRTCALTRSFPFVPIPLHFVFLFSGLDLLVLLVLSRILLLHYLLSCIFALRSHSFSSFPSPVGFSVARPVRVLSTPPPS